MKYLTLLSSFVFLLFLIHCNTEPNSSTEDGISKEQKAIIMQIEANTKILELTKQELDESIEELELILATL